MAFDIPVSEYASAPVHGVDPETPLPMVQHRLASLGLQCLAVTDGSRLVGVVSRSDLIEVGQRETGRRASAALLSLPGKPVSEVMSTEPVTVDPESTVARAAAIMRERQIHRVFAVAGERLVGVLSTYDLMKVIRDKRSDAPINALMASPVFTVRASEPISLATERLGKARVSGLVVVDDEWPVGLFTQAEALECRDLARDTAIDEVMNPGMICMPSDTRVFRAAQQAIAMTARRIIAVEKREMVGIVGGLDFAAFAASS